MDFSTLRKGTRARACFWRTAPSENRRLIGLDNNTQYSENSHSYTPKYSRYAPSPSLRPPLGVCTQLLTHQPVARTTCGRHEHVQAKVHVPAACGGAWDFAATGVAHATRIWRSRACSWHRGTRRVGGSEAALQDRRDASQRQGRSAVCGIIPRNPPEDQTTESFPTCTRAYWQGRAAEQR